MTREEFEKEASKKKKELIDAYEYCYFLNDQKHWDILYNVISTCFDNLQPPSNGMRSKEELNMQNQEQEIKIVECINNLHNELYLTIGKRYKVIEQDWSSFLIKTDLMKECYYSKTFFKKINMEPQDQQFEEITKDNIKEVLEYNNWLNYNNSFGGYTNETVTKEIFEGKFKPYIDMDLSIDVYKVYFNNSKNISTNDFDLFVLFIKKHVPLNGLPTKPKFDARQYLLDNGFELDLDYEELFGYAYARRLGVWLELNNEIFKIAGGQFQLTKENIDIVIEASKTLEKLK
jgi:hypothetical protein